MPVFRWGQTWDPFRDLEREVDRLLSGMSISLQGVRLGRNYPAVNLYELESEFVLTAEIPGCKPEDIELTVADGMISLRGKTLGVEGITDDRYRRQERPRGNWQRSVPLPDRVADSEMAAEFNNGILKIRLPKTAKGRARQIPIADGSTATHSAYNVTTIEAQRGDAQ